VLASQLYVGSIRIVGNDIYWTDAAGIMKMPKAGGTPTLAANGSAADLQSDGSAVYWTDWNVTPASVVSQPIAGGAQTVLLQFEVLRGLALDDSSAYSVQTNWGTGHDAMIVKVPKIGGPAQILGPTMDRAPTPEEGLAVADDLAVDGDTLYWTMENQGTLMHMPKNGGPKHPVLSNLGHPSHIAVDTSGVYWINEGAFPGSGASDGSIMRIPH
jgi:hypothetical protein